MVGLLVLAIVAIGIWIFLIPKNIKCKVPVIGGSCNGNGNGESDRGTETFGFDIRVPSSVLPQSNYAWHSNFARAQMLRGIY